MKKFLAIILAALMLLGACACGNKKEDNLLMWEVKSGGATVYILANSDYATNDLYPLSDTIMEAYNKSGYLMAESNPELVMPGGSVVVSSDGTRLQDTIGQEMFDYYYQRLHTLLSDLTVEKLEDFTPLGLYVLASTMPIYAAGQLPEYSPMIKFLEFAEKDGKPVLYAEDDAERIETISDYEEIAIAWLELCYNNTYDPEALKETYTNMYLTWRSGSLSAFEELAVPEIPDVSALRMIEDSVAVRNLVMADSVERCLTGDQDTFVVLGASHVLGDEGVLALLRERGYSVTLVSGAE